MFPQERPRITRYPFRPLIILNQRPHHAGQMIFQRQRHLDHILMRRIVVGIEQVMEMLYKCEWMGDDHRATLLQVFQSSRVSPACIPNAVSETYTISSIVVPQRTFHLSQKAIIAVLRRRLETRLLDPAPINLHHIRPRLISACPHQVLQGRE